MSELRVYFDIVDAKWKVRGYEQAHFSTEEDAHAACDLAVWYAPDMVAAMTGNSVQLAKDPT